MWLRDSSFQIGFGESEGSRCGHELNGFTLADPNDLGMLDVMGFDTSVKERPTFMVTLK